MDLESEVESEKSSKVAISSRFRPWDLSHRVRRIILRRSVEFHRIWWVLGRVGVKIWSLELSARFWGDTAKSINSKKPYRAKTLPPFVTPARLPAPTALTVRRPAHMGGSNSSPSGPCQRVTRWGLN